MSYFSIRARLIFLAILLLAILVAVAALLTRELARDSEALSEEARLVSIVRNANNASKHFGDLKYWLTDFSATLLASSQHNAEVAKGQLDADLKTIAPVDAKGVATIEQDVDALWALALKAAEAYSGDDSAGGNALMAQAQARILNVNNEIEEIVNRVEQQALSRRDASMRNARRAVEVAITGGLIALALALAVTAFIVRSINAPLRRLERSMNAITQGQLDVAIPNAGRDEIGGMTRALAMLRDSLIESHRLEQERQRAEAEARRAQAQLSEAIEAISEGFALYDADDRLVVCNSRFKEMYVGTGLEIQPGIQHETILRKAAETGIVPLPPDKRDAWIAERLDRHCNPKGAFEQQRSHGVWLKISERRTADGGNVGVLTDITELKDRELQLGELVDRLADARDAAMEATVAKSRFLANMSHELRTPLNAVIGITEMLIEDTEEADNHSAREPLERILRAGKHLLQLINEVLDLSKIEAGKLEITYETVDVAARVNDLVGEVEPLAQKNANRFVVECPSDIGTVRSDPTRLRQIILNLLGNACKFTEHGRVSLSVSRSRSNGEEFISFRVADTGIGMTEEQLGKLFQEFSQADNSTTRKYGGTGLGLAISDRLCRMMGGTIEVESKLGVGTTFTMRVPADRAGVADAVAVPTAAIPPEQIRPARTNRVLVIDDDATVRDLMRRYLSREGFDVVTAAGGREGLEFARELHPSVITLDVFMPDMDGWSVLQAIKQDAELSRIPVVMMTISDEKQKGITLGASGYLTKPVDRAQLAQLLDRFKTAMPRALVVEDNLTDRDMMRRLLVGEGWEVIVASNGREALDRLKSENPNLILLDLMMPEMDGFEFLAEFRKTPKFASTPVIVVTAADLSREDRRRLDGGVEHILQKAAPSREDFLRQIRDLIGRYAVVAEFSAVDG
jgi:signal transduction histidine kinase/CheY-like chemotaxis protein/HAMP domain-containing protein